MENFPIVTDMTAYDDQKTGQTYILVFNESLYYGSKFDHTLIHPNQLRYYGIQYNENPYDRHMGLNIVVNNNLTINIQSKGMKVRFEPRVPTKEDLSSCEKIVMTSPSEYNPEQLIMQEINVKDKLYSPYLFNEAKNEHV